MTTESRTAEPGTAPQADDRIFLWGVSLLAVAIFVGVALAAGFRFGPSNAADSAGGEAPRHLVDFSLTERSGRTVGSADVRGKILVVNFVHTGCSISCGIVNQRMAEVQRLVVGQDDVQLLSLTVDPGTDTPPVLTKFARQFGADPERWLFLTGDRRSIYQLIETSFLSRDTGAGPAEMPGGFRKADHIALVDRDGQVRKLFPGMKLETPAAIMQAIAALRGAPARRDGQTSTNSR